MSKQKVPEPYSVSPASLKCECCGDGPTWEVVLKLDGQSEIAMGTEYEEEWAADEEANGLNGAFSEGWRAALEWAAKEARAAGCECAALRKTYRFTAPHHSSCPVALAAKIREGAP